VALSAFLALALPQYSPGDGGNLIRDRRPPRRVWNPEIPNTKQENQPHDGDVPS
jgi:hypothetical protein